MGTTLITGADGYLGSRITQALLRACDDKVVLAVRCRDRHELESKTAGFERDLGLDRISVLPADLHEPEPFAGMDPHSITRIVHAAALTRFNVDRGSAAAVNVAGTVRIAELAARCARLERFVALSTLYAVGKVTGTVAETHEPEPEFVNHYEWSKWAAEEELLRADLPNLVIARMPTVIADDDDGSVVQYNAFHNTLRLYFYGLMSLLPGEPATPLTIATAHFATSAVQALLETDAPTGIVHVCPDPGDTITLNAAIETAFDAFSGDPAFRKRRLLPPVVCDRDSFEDLCSAVARMPGGPVNAALGSITPFAEQLYQPKRFDNARLREAWPACPRTDSVALVEAVCLDLVATRWGRNQRRADVPAVA